jgi:type II secretion system protein N
MKRFRKWLFYIAFTLLAMGFFLYFLFPSETFKGAVSTYLLKTFPAYQIEIGRLRPVLPAGLGFESIGIFQRGRLWASFDRITVLPKLSTLLSSQKTINFRGSAYAGTLGGHIDINQRDNKRQTEIVLKLFEMDLSEIQNLQEAMERKLSGSLNGMLTIVHSSGSRPNLKGKLDLSGVRLEFSNPITKIEEISLNDVATEFNVNKKVFSMKRLEAMGGQIEGNLTGTIMIRRPFERSRLNLRGAFLPQEMLMASMQHILPGNLFKQRQTGAKGMPIRIYGTIEKPRFSFR